MENINVSNGLEEICKFLKEAGIYYLATIEEGGLPRVRPFGTINLFEGKLYIQTGKCKDVSKQIHKNGRVEISAVNKDASRWIRFAGELKEDARIEPKKAMLDNYPELRAMYNENDGNTEVFYFVHGTCTFCSFTEKPQTIKF